MNEKELKILVADTIMERPKGFSIGSRHFYLYPVTLGKTFLVTRYIEQLEINADILALNPIAECLRLATTKKDECCRLIALHTCKGKTQVFDTLLNDKRTKALLTLSAEELATLMTQVLVSDRTGEIKEFLGIAEEEKLMQQAQSAKDADKSTLSFGGRSAYGSLIDAACERYGWEFDYVLWGISYANLVLLLGDSIKTLYLSEEERKRVHIHRKGETLSADDPSNREEILKMRFN